MDPRGRRITAIPMLFSAVMLIASLSVYFLYEPEYKLLILAAAFLLNILFYSRTASSLSAALLSLLLVLPFNITFLIPGVSETAYVSGILVNYLLPYISITDIFVIQLVLVLLASVGKFKKIDMKWFALIVLLGVLQVFLFRAPNVVVYSIRFVTYLLCGLLVYESWGNIARSFKSDRKYYLSIILFSLLFQLTLGLLQVMNGNSMGLSILGESAVSAGFVDASTVSIDGNLKLRAYGTFPHPNVLAGWFLTIYLTILVFIKKHEPILWFFAALSLLGVAITLSQTAIITAIVVTAFYWISKKVRFVFTPTALPSVLSLMIPEKDSVTERISLLRSSLRYFRENWFSGVGAGNFTRNFYQYAPLDVGGMTLMQPVHNIFVLFLVEFGAVGVVVIALALIMILRKGRIEILKREPLLFLLVIVLIGSADHYLLTLPQGIVLLLVLFSFILTSVNTGRQINP